MSQGIFKFSAGGRDTADTARPTKGVSVGADTVGDAPLRTCVLPFTSYWVFTRTRSCTRQSRTAWLSALFRFKTVSNLEAMNLRSFHVPHPWHS